jgi:diguanylate cyclase (GGDEF)-like protein
LLGFSVHGQTLSEYLADDEKIMLDPWGSYQVITQQNSTQQQLPVSEEKLVFLLRKARAEHLLNYFSKFRTTVKQIESIATPDTSLALRSRANVFKGIAARINSQYTESEAYLNLALQQAKNVGLPRLSVFAKQELAYTHALYELFDTSLKDLQEAYVTAFSLNDDYLIAIINETYGAIYGYMLDYPKSIEYYQKARSDYERLGYPAHYSNALYGLASTYRYWKKYDEAIKYFERYVENSLYTPEMKSSFYGLYGLAMTLAEQGSCDAAITQIDDAIALPGVDDYDAELYKAKSQCMIKLNRLVEAETALNASKAIFDALPDLQETTWHVELLKIESELAFAQNKKDKAYALLRKYHEKYVAIIQSNSSVKFLQMQVTMGIEQQNVELSLLQQRGRVQDLVLEQRSQQNRQLGYLVVFVICLIVIAIGALIFQRNYSNKLFALSITDSLTGLYNRHYIFEYLTKVIERSASDKQSVSVIIIDIDNFKEVNDTYGHPFGDYIIKTIADLTEETLRVEDVMGRIGGEEFFCVLPRISKRQCTEVAQRIVNCINQHTFITQQGKAINVTVSIGIANAKSGCCDSDSLYAQADHALYESKRLGKNRVTTYYEDESIQQ